MTEPPPRNRFQIHLSTAMVMMFVAGGIFWLNISNAQRTEGKPGLSFMVIYGWPYKAYGEWYYNRSHAPLEKLKDWTRETKIFTNGVCQNAAVAIVILLTTWFLCESLIRRRAARIER